MTSSLAVLARPIRIVWGEMLYLRPNYSGLKASVFAGERNDTSQARSTYLQESHPTFTALLPS